MYIGSNDYDTSCGKTLDGKTPEEIMNILIEQINAYFNSGGTKTKSFVGKICEAAIYMDSDEFYTTLGRIFFWEVFSHSLTHSLTN
jgi:hypothetical protein